MEATGSTQRCARGDFCAWRTTRFENGHDIIEAKEVSAKPGPYRSPFCDRDHQLVGEYLKDIPRLYLLLAAEIGHLQAQPFTPITGSAEASVPLNLLVDALMRTMADELISWHERVAAAASITPPRARHPGCPSHDGIEQVAEACRILLPRCDLLLALPPETMNRRMTVAAAAGLMLEQDAALQAAALAEDPDLTPWLGGLIRPYADYAEIDLPLSGSDAGLEIIGLRGRARFILGETKPVPDELLGVRCKQCSRKALYRADQVAADRTNDYSACSFCGHRMGHSEYFTWVRQWYVYERARQKAERLDVA